MRKEFCMHAKSAILVSLMLLGAFFVVATDTVAAAQDGDYIYSESGGVATITGYTGAGGAIAIPSTLDGYPTVAIGNYAFSHIISLTTVTIPSSVTTIGGAAFADCTSLISATIPSSVTSIGSYAFSYCTSMTAIDVNAANANYASISGVLYNKAATTLIQCPGGKAGALIIPSSVTSISSSGFSQCIALTSVTIPNSVTSIGDAAFFNCTSLTSATIGSGVTSIGDYMFADCVSLTSIVIPIGVTSIGGASFSHCTALTSVTIPNGVTTIGVSAFYYCTALTSVTIPSSVTSIGSSAFTYCISMTAIDVNAGNPNYASIDGVLYNKAVTTLIQCPGGKTGVVTVPSSVTSIGSTAFGYCASLTSITFLGLVAPTSIGVNWIEGTDAGIRGHAYAASNFPAPGSAFNGLTMGTVIPEGDYTYTLSGGQATITRYTGAGGAVAIPSTLDGYSTVAIGNYAFANSTSLTSITIPNGVTTIGNYAFYNCTSLTSVTIGSGVTTIGSHAFANCTSLISITFLGLVAPTTVGANWILGTDVGILGHAYLASNFPAPGGVWNGLTMGTVISVIPASDDTMLIVALISVAVIAIAVVLVAVLFVMPKRKGKK
jgi:hypothetical protein